MNEGKEDKDRKEINVRYFYYLTKALGFEPEEFVTTKTNKKLTVAQLKELKDFRFKIFIQQNRKLFEELQKRPEEIEKLKLKFLL